jgi:hypothetical protein
MPDHFEQMIPLKYRPLYESLDVERQRNWYMWWETGGRRLPGADQVEIFGDDLVPPWARKLLTGEDYYAEEDVEENPASADDRLRRAERRYAEERSPEAWAEYQNARVRAGDQFYRHLNEWAPECQFLGSEEVPSRHTFGFGSPYWGPGYDYYYCPPGSAAPEARLLARWGNQTNDWSADNVLRFAFLLQEDPTLEGWSDFHRRLYRAAVRGKAPVPYWIPDGCPDCRLLEVDHDRKLDFYHCRGRGSDVRVRSGHIAPEHSWGCAVQYLPRLASGSPMFHVSAGRTEWEPAGSVEMARLALDVALRHGLVPEELL